MTFDMPQSEPGTLLGPWAEDGHWFIIASHPVYRRITLLTWDDSQWVECSYNLINQMLILNARDEAKSVLLRQALQVIDPSQTELISSIEKALSPPSPDILDDVNITHGVPKNMLQRAVIQAAEGGYLTIVRDDEGDVSVDISEKAPGFGAKLRFCSLQGGGRTPHTRRALADLMLAIQKDAGKCAEF